ncbi:MAG: hypothetical protein ACI85I_001732 [Arenicella sp.]|jgi:hypothetical protein
MRFLNEIMEHYECQVSNKPNYHDAHADFLTILFNFCRQNEVLKELINPDAPLFKTKYLRKLPAMADSNSRFRFSVRKKMFFLYFPCQSVCEVRAFRRNPCSNHARTSKLERKILEI